MKTENKKKEKIAVLGLGYVGLPTFLVLSNIKKNNSFIYHVIGVEKNDKQGRKKAIVSKTR